MQQQQHLWVLCLALGALYACEGFLVGLKSPSSAAGTRYGRFQVSLLAPLRGEDPICALRKQFEPGVENVIGVSNRLGTCR